MIGRDGNQDNKGFLSRNSTLYRRKEMPSKGKSFPLNLCRSLRWEASKHVGKEVDDKRKWLLTLGISEELGMNGFKSIAEEISLPRNSLFLRPTKGQ